MRRCVTANRPTCPTIQATSGSFLTETAIVLTLFLALTFAIFEAGRMLWSFTTLSNAVSEGVRCASVRSTKSSNTSNCNYTSCSASDIACLVQTMATGVVPTPVVTCNGSTCSAPTKPGDVIKVEATSNFQPVIPIGILLGGGSSGTLALSAASEMTVVR